MQLNAAANVGEILAEKKKKRAERFVYLDFSKYFIYNFSGNRIIKSEILNILEPSIYV